MDVRRNHRLSSAWRRGLTRAVVVCAVAGVVAPVAFGSAAVGKPCTTATRSAQAVQPFCDHPYEWEQTQDGTVYRTAVNHAGDLEELALDVYEPLGDPPGSLRPVVLWMHGGFFEFGGRADDGQVFEDFASRGFVVVSIDYRVQDLPPDTGVISVPTPGAVQDTLEDAVAAVQWIHANAATLRIDPASVIASGYSAGAITALGLAHKPTAITPPGGPSLIAAAVSFSGLDLHGVAPSRPDDPPVLMFNGEQDSIVPIGAARATCKGTVLTGSECDLIPLPGQGHTNGDPATYQTSVSWLAAHGIDELSACDRFDVPTVDYSTTTTTTSGNTTSTIGPVTTTEPAVAGRDVAPGATPIPSTPAFTG